MQVGDPVHAAVAVDDALARVVGHPRGPHVMPAAREVRRPRVAAGLGLEPDTAQPGAADGGGEDLQRAPHAAAVELAQAPVELDAAHPERVAVAPQAHAALRVGAGSKRADSPICSSGARPELRRAVPTMSPSSSGASERSSPGGLGELGGDLGGAAGPGAPWNGERVPAQHVLEHPRDVARGAAPVAQRRRGGHVGGAGRLLVRALEARGQAQLHVEQAFRALDGLGEGQIAEDRRAGDLMRG